MEELLRTSEARMLELLDDIFFADLMVEKIPTILDMENTTEKGAGKIVACCEEIRNIIGVASNTPDAAQSAANTSITSATSAPDQQNQANRPADAQKQPGNEQSQKLQEMAVKVLVTHMSNNTNPIQAKLFTNVIIRLINYGCFSARSMCIALLSHDNLVPNQRVFWLFTFGFVKTVISSVDYKGVREIMKLSLDRARSIQIEIEKSQIRQVQALVDLMEIIFDSNAALLPGYFIINELLKIYPDYKSWPHWRLSGLLTDFVDNFRRAAQMLSIIGRPKLRPIVELLGHSSSSIISWRLDSVTLKFPLKGSLPFAPDIQGPQPELLCHLLKQPYSKEMICSMLDLQKKKSRCIALEEQLVELIIQSMEECDIADKLSSELPVENRTLHYCPCPYTSSLLIYLMLYQMISFQSLVQSLHEKLSISRQRKGRNHLMWVLLQFLSGTIHKNPVTDFHPVLQLIELLYPENEPLSIPDHKDPRCVMELSGICILIHILRKATSDNLKTPHSLPPAFIAHNELIQNLVHNHQLNHLAFQQNPPDYRIALLLNAYSTNQEIFLRPIMAINEHIQGSQKSTVTMPGVNCVAYGSTEPLSMTFLDSLTIHAKMTLIHHIVQHITKQAHNKSTVYLAPALVETYARLLVYTETESIGIKQFTTILLPIVYKSQVWGILHGLIEMFTHRIHHSPHHYRVQLLSTIHTIHTAIPLNAMPNMTQLLLCMESAALRLITGLGNSEIMPSLMRFFSTESKPNVISAESEELNRVLVLTMARAIHMTGCDGSSETARWCIDFLKAVMTHTPHNWATHTMANFPPIIAEFYKAHGQARDTSNLKKVVEEEYRKWKSMSNENDIIAHFSIQHQQSTLFLCLVFKMVLDTNKIPAEAFKVLERVGPRQLMQHVRTLCDFLVLEFSNSPRAQLAKCVDTMNSIIWDYCVVPIDRLMLCLALRTQEASNEAQVCLLIIQLLLLKPFDMRTRLQDFVIDSNSPEHWTMINGFEKHSAYHRKYQEKFAPEDPKGLVVTPPQPNSLPTYFSTWVHRFVPIFDIIIHKFLEVPQVHKRLETILEQLGMIYKFHDKPFTYLYNTFHYYEERIRDGPSTKRLLISAIVLAQQEIKPPNWSLSKEYMQYIACPPSEEDIIWKPSMTYYVNLVQRMVHTLQGKNPFPVLEWRFNEFINMGSHALHVTAVELMGLPMPPHVVANNLFDVIIKGYLIWDREEVFEWINAVGLILTWLPDAYNSVVHDRIIGLLKHPDILTPTKRSLTPFELFDLKSLLPRCSNMEPGLTLAIIQSYWHHSSFGQIGKIPTLMKERINPMLTTEEQLVTVCHLVGPFLQRFHIELPLGKIVEVALELYQGLAIIDKNVKELKYQDAICDILYHIKYQFTGDSMRNGVERIIRGLRQSLQLRLRFIAHLNLDSSDATSASGSNASSVSNSGNSGLSTTVGGPTSFSTSTTSAIASTAASTTVNITNPAMSVGASTSSLNIPMSM